MSTNAPVLSKSTKEYRRRKPEYSPYYQCIEDYYEQFKRSYDRNFSKKYGYLSKLSWETVKDHYISTCRKADANPAAVAVIQTFGDYLSSGPHMHILAADGCFGDDGFFYVPSINIDTASIEKLFIHKIFKMLLKKGLITEKIIDLVLSWRHTGFGVYCGKRINPKDGRSREFLARYIIRASFSQERMKYHPDEAKVTYESKYGKEVKEFSCLEWMAALVSHIPDRGGQTVRYLPSLQ